MATRRDFTTNNGYILTLITNKTNIQLEVRDTEGLEIDHYKYQPLLFSDETFKTLHEAFHTEANKVWKSLTIKEADSYGNDYDEYYDRVLDNNGNLAIKQNQLTVTKVYEGSHRVYQFNKQKMGTFLYDMDKFMEVN